jgi:hypothetical protein
MEHGLLLGLGRVAILLCHLFKALAFAGVLALARIIRPFARRLTLARIDAITMYLRLVGGCGGDGCDAEKESGGRGNGRSRDWLRDQHRKLLVLVKVADEELSSLTHLT